MNIKCMDIIIHSNVQPWTSIQKYLFLEYFWSVNANYITIFHLVSAV